LTPERWVQIRQIFDGALELRKEDRAVYLRVVCARDEPLRKEVESMLASHEESGDFLNAPAAELNRSLLTMEDRSAEFPAIPRVGPYQLEKRIGRGGMGAVWLASRVDQEYQKKVAIKMVKRGMDTSEILRRFRMERQVLASLDHPNIARLIDGGSTPDGLPYLVMEYVEGTPIDHYCEQHMSSISERLKLFRSVCAAVQYAHSNLVVHRDLKAGNILVARDGTPKLLDFGIAKLMQAEFSTMAVTETRPELRPMTLEYASPEQVRGEVISTASDVYSLGVLLYKLLTGKFPYGEANRSRMAMQQAICEKDPPRPSSVVLSDTDSAIPQATQKMEVPQAETRVKARRRLKRKLSGDLDVIILKALRKDPSRRYASVEQLSEDIRRYLEGRPVRARGDTMGYRTLKFVKRNAAGVGAMAALLALLLGSTIWFGIKVRHDQASADAARSRELALEPAMIRAYERLGDLDQSSDPRRAAAEYRQAVETARDYLKMYPQDRGSDQMLNMRRDLARDSIKLGDLEPGEAAALYNDALAQFEAAAKFEAIAKNDSGRAQHHAEEQADIMAAERKVGLAQFAAGDLVAALTSFSHALQTAEALPSSPELRRAIAACNFEMGEVLAANHEPDVALANLRKALDLYSDLAGSPRGAPVKDRSPQGFEQALAMVAAGAPADLRSEINAELRRMRK
jgi:serine/threonine protein kinase